MHQGYVDTWQAIQFTSSASQWRGAFSIPALKDEHGNIPAGNARTGRLIGPVWDPSGDGTRAVDQTLFLFDLDLTDKKTVRDHFEQVTLVIGPKSFPKPYPGAPFGDAVELPMTIYVVDGYPNYTRFGPSGWVPGRKLLCAQVDTADLRALAGDARSLQYYGRIALDGDRTAFINGAGKAYRNFELPVADLASAGEV